MNLTISPIPLIAENEFRRVVGHPLVLFVSLVLFIFAMLNGIGGKDILAGSMINTNAGDVILSIGYGQVLYSTAFLCTIVAVFTGAMSTVQEQSTGSLLVLLGKPLYRRSIIIGKFLGLDIFVLLFIAVNVMINTLLMILYFQAPAQLEDFSLRMFSLVLVLFIECSLSLAIMMLVSIVLQDLLKVALIAVTYIYLEWFAVVNGIIGAWNYVSPQCMFFNMVLGDGTLLDTSTGYTTWLTMYLPQLAFMIACIAVILLVGCALFGKKDEL